MERRREEWSLGCEPGCSNGFFAEGVDRINANQGGIWLLMKDFLALIPLVAVIGCTTPNTGARSNLIDLDHGTTEISGWIRFGPELAIFPTKNIDRYDPNGPLEQRCVTLTLPKGHDRSELLAFDTRYVRVKGRSIDFETLMKNRNTPLFQDYILINEKPIFNWCLRRFIFEIDEISSENKIYKIEDLDMGVEGKY